MNHTQQTTPPAQPIQQFGIGNVIATINTLPARQDNAPDACDVIVTCKGWLVIRKEFTQASGDNHKAARDWAIYKVEATAEHPPEWIL